MNTNAALSCHRIVSLHKSSEDLLSLSCAGTKPGAPAASAIRQGLLTSIELAALYLKLTLLHLPGRK